MSTLYEVLYEFTEDPCLSNFVNADGDVTGKKINLFTNDNYKYDIIDTLLKINRSTFTEYTNCEDILIRINTENEINVFKSKISIINISSGWNYLYVLKLTINVRTGMPRYLDELVATKGHNQIFCWGRYEIANAIDKHILGKFKHIFVEGKQQ